MFLPLQESEPLCQQSTSQWSFYICTEAAKWHMLILKKDCISMAFCLVAAALLYTFKG